jgi:Phosphotransferase enzyme family
VSETAVCPEGRLIDLLPQELARIEWAPTLPTVAHPSWAGGDSAFYEGRSLGGTELLARVLRPTVAMRTDPSVVFSAMVVAAAAGLAPTVVFHDAAHGVCVQEKLGDAWQIATLYRLLDADARQAALDVRLRFRELAPDLPFASVFDQVASLLVHVRSGAVYVPAMAHEVVAAVEAARDCCAVAGPPAVACHGDGTVSNVMLSASGARLVGWTQAARMDPLEEVGSVLTELVPFVDDAETVFEALWGDRDPVAFARAQLYGVADDLRWALIGFCAAASQAGSGIEYSRYAQWRLQKARCAVTNGGQFARWIGEAR